VTFAERAENMKVRKVALVVASVLLGLAAVLYLSFDFLILHAPGWIGRWRDPTGANRAMVWEPGLTTPAAPSALRPPNIVVIVADDLGYNDLTFAGGGVANGAVPTPNIDSIAHAGVEFTRAPKAFMRLVARWGHDAARPPHYFAEREADEIDAVDLVGLARGGAAGQAHDALFWRSCHYRSILAGAFKLQVSERPKKTWLFDMKADPTERTNLAGARPEKVQELTALLASKDAQMAPPMRPSLIEGPIAIDPPLGVPAGPDGEVVDWAN